MIRLMKPLQWARPHLIPVTAKITVHSSDAVERSLPSGGVYVDSMRKIVMQPVRVFWCLAFGSEASKRVVDRYSGATRAAVRGGACKVLSKAVRIPGVEDGAIAEIQILKQP